MTWPYLDKLDTAVWEATLNLSSAVSEAAKKHGISDTEAELIMTRASQLNQCAYCLNIHADDARTAGVTQQQLDLLPTWRGSSLFSERERAVLAIAEAVTSVPHTPAVEAELASARELLGDEAFAASEWVAITINMFNRISILSDYPVRLR